jgi:transposase
MEAAAVVVGIDVSKRTLEVALSDGGGFRVTNDEDGISELLARLRPSGAALVVLEASGGYERAAYLALWEAGVPTALINPRDAYHFAQAHRQLAKTDQLDARGLCEFGLRMQPQPLPPPEAADEQLKALAVRRRQVIKMLAAERTRVQQAPRAVRPASSAWCGRWRASSVRSTIRSNNACGIIRAWRNAARNSSRCRDWGR